MLEQAEKIFISYLKDRIMRTLFIFQKMGVWHCVLTDLNKTELFLEKYRKKLDMDENSIECLNNYGVVLSSGQGLVPHKLSQEVSNKLPILQLIDKEFLLFRLSKEGIDEIFYVLSNVDKKQYILEATSAEDIENYGKILYSTLDVDPPEAIPMSEIIKQILSIDSGYLSVDRSHMMIRKGEIQKMRLFLGEGGDVNRVDKYGWTMLHHGAHCGNLDIINLLINAGCDIHAQDNCGRKSVHIAARESHFKVIELFFKNGVNNVNEIDKNGWTLLHYAAWKGNLETVRFLIHNMVEINAKDKVLGKRPLHIAAQQGHREVVELLLENAAHINDLDENGGTPFFYSVWAKDLEMAQFLINKGANIGIANKRGFQPLHLAVCTTTTNCKMIALLLANGLDIEHKSNKGATPLHIAAFLGSLDNVKFLIEKGANLFAVCNEGHTCLHFAKEHVEVASYLADRMIDMFERQCRYDDALKVYEELIQIQEKKLGLGHTDTLRTHFEAATMLYEQARFVDALNILHNVNEEGLCRDHLEALYKKCNLGLSISGAQTKFSETVGCFEEVFKRWKEDLRKDHMDPLNVACDKAYDHFKKCEYTETFNTLSVALLKKKSLFDIDQPD